MPRDKQPHRFSSSRTNRGCEPTASASSGPACEIHGLLRSDTMYPSHCPGANSARVRLQLSHRQHSVYSLAMRRRSQNSANV
eukprot:1045935-Amphidinium_carterae.1